MCDIKYIEQISLFLQIRFFQKYEDFCQPEACVKIKDKK